jgi:hypothetical protein
VVAYFVLELMTIDTVAEVVGAPNLIYELGIEWVGKRREAFPRLVRVPRNKRDVYTRLWQEAAILLAVQSPSATVEGILRTKARRFADEFGGPGLMAAANSLIRSRLPRGTPFQAIAYLNTVLRNAAQAESHELRGAARVPRSTLQRYRSQGLDVGATEAELPEYIRTNELRRQHRAEGLRTKRQLALDLTEALGFTVSLRAVGNAIASIEAQLGTAAPRDGSVLRLDPRWCKLIRDVIINRKSKKNGIGG